MRFGASLLVAAFVGAAPAVAAEAGAPAEAKAARRGTPAAMAELRHGAAPGRAVHAQVCGLHFYSGDLTRQVIAYHDCAHASADVWQCVLYDSDAVGARLIGVEYIISGQVFQTLPEDERKLWHSHAYEVKSGVLIAPQLPEAAEKELMKTLAGTYGKTWQTWQVDRGDQVPLGLPQLMMGLTADGQANPELLAARDRATGISTEEKRKNRADIIAPAIQTGADAWQSGEAVQLQTTTVKSR